MGTEVTVVDVARHAGVSTSTAARALGGYGIVKDSTYQRIQESAKSLGYRTNALARSMITGRTSTIGVVIADITNPFFANLVRGVSDVATGEGLEVLLVNTDEGLAAEKKAVHLLLEKRVDGLIVAPASRDESPHLIAAIGTGTKLVLVDRSVAGVDVDSIGLENFKAAYSAVGRFIAAGHVRIAFLSGALRPDRSRSRSDVSSNSERREGYLQALKDAHIPLDDSYTRIGGPRREDGALESRALLALEDRPTAILAGDSLMSIALLEEVQRAGLRVPEDLSIIGFDDSDWSAVVSPPLSVIAQPAYEMGRQSAQRLVERLQGVATPAREYRLESTFIERKSIAPIIHPSIPEADSLLPSARTLRDERKV